MNALDSGPGDGYSDAFLALTVPLLDLRAISFTLRRWPEKGCAAPVWGNI